MNQFLKIFCLITLCLSGASAYGELWGFSELQGYIALDNGYRWDKISNRATLGGPTATVKSSTQILKRINSYQLGGRGQLYFWDCAFVKGSGHYGWVGDGKYSEGSFFGKSQGHTCDGQGALGYYYNLSPNIWVAPIVGWSYDALKLKGTGIKTAIDGIVYHMCSVRAHQQFSGPFVGFDLLFQTQCYDFSFSYEFHYAHWHGQRLIQGGEYGNPPFGTTTGFSNQRRLNNVYGQVFNLQASYQFCDCWIVGLGLKYQFYNGDFGKYRQTKRPILSQFTYANVDGLWWLSFASTLYIGRMF